MGVWIIPCNSSFYDIEGAFERFDRLDWKQSRKLEVGDVVYIYVGRPTKAIMYKCRVNKTNLPELEIDDSAFVINDSAYANYGNYMELELLHKFRSDQLPLETLFDHGLQGNIQGPRHASAELQNLFRAAECV